MVCPITLTVNHRGTILAPRFHENRSCVVLILLAAITGTAAGPRLWNTLPIQLRHCDSLGQFKRLLKTYLFGGWDRGAL